MPNEMPTRKTKILMRGSIRGDHAARLAEDADHQERRRGHASSCKAHPWLANDLSVSLPCKSMSTCTLHGKLRR
jgi:hypothetical protein